MIKNFRAAGAKRRYIEHPFLSENESTTTYAIGVRWPALRAFIAHLDVLDMKVVGVNLYKGVGAGVEAIERLNLSDGVYMIAGFTKSKEGHAVIAEVSFKRTCVRIYEKDEVQDIHALASWLHGISFVRRLVKKPVPGQEAK